MTTNSHASKDTSTTTCLAQELTLITTALNRITGKHAITHYYSLPVITQATPEALAILENIKTEELASHNLTLASNWPIRTDGLVARLQITIIQLDPTAILEW